MSYVPRTWCLVEMLPTPSAGSLDGGTTTVATSAFLSTVFKVNNAEGRGGGRVGMTFHRLLTIDLLLYYTCKASYL